MKKITLLLILTLFMPAYLRAASMDNYCSAPPYVTRSVAPNVMIMMDNSNDMLNPAYSDTYSPNATKDNYVGYFKPQACYKYSTNKFEEQLKAAGPPEVSYAYTDTCPAAAPFRGNLLNWATMSKYDILEKVIIGGNTVSKQGNAHTLLSISGTWTRTYQGCTFQVNNANLTITESVAGGCILLNSPSEPIALWDIRWLGTILTRIYNGIRTDIYNYLANRTEVLFASLAGKWEEISLIARAWAGGTCSISVGTLNGNVGSSYSLELTASGTTGSANYTWATGASWPAWLTTTPVISGTKNSKATYTSTPASPGTYAFSATVNNAGCDNGPVAVNGNIVITAPTLLIVNAPSSALTGTVGQAFSFTTMYGTGGVTPYTWSVSAGALPSGLSLTQAGSPGAPTISGTPTTAGSYSATIRLSDNYAGNNPDPTTVINFTISASSLAISTASLPNGTTGTAYGPVTMAASGGNPGYTWSVSAGSFPAGVSMTAGGVISGTPTAGSQGNYNVTIRVTDSFGSAVTRAYSFTIAAGGGSPTITTTSLPDAIKNIFYSYQVLGSGGLTPYTWSATGLPPSGSLTINSSTGVISGTPGGADAGASYNVTVTLRDDNLNTSIKSFTLNILHAAPAVLSISTATLPNGVTGSAYGPVTMQASGGTSPYTWSLVAGAWPSGVSMTAGGVISGTPAGGSQGTYNVTLRVIDNVGTSVTQAYTFTIALGGGTPTINTTSLPEAVKGTAYSYQMLGSGGLSPYTWSATGLPASMSIDPVSGTISGTPTASEAGNPYTDYTVTISLTDANGTVVSKVLTLRVNKVLTTRSQTFNVKVDLIEEPLTDLNGNGIWDLGETYTDSNGNGQWDGKQGIFQRFWDDNNPKARWGLTKFGSQGATVTVEADACPPASPASSFYTRVQNATPTDSSPLASGLYGDINYFGFSVANFASYDSGSYNGCSNSDAIDSVSCRKNFVLIISSGSNVGGDSFTSNATCSQSDPLVRNACYGYNFDLRSDKPNKQNVYTYVVNTMGTNAANNTIMQNAATAGGGKYYDATDASNLETQLVRAFTDILAQASSGTAVSVLTTSSRGVGSMTQAFFLPTKLEGTREVWWTGYTEQIWIDPQDNLREDTVHDYSLKLNQDKVMKIYFDEAANDTKVALFTTDTEGGDDGSATSLASCSAPTIKSFSQIEPIWEAGNLLALMNPSSRKIFSSKKVIRDGTTTTLDGTSDPLKPYFDTAMSATLKNALDADATYTADNIIRYVRGECLETGVTGDTACGATANSTYRDRRLTVTGGGANGNVWKLGDVISSTPKVVSNAPANTYHIDYTDSTYYQYISSSAYKQRSALAFAGANDGMLHAFRVGYLKDKTDNNGSLLSGVKALFRNFYSSTDATNNELGKEAWGYIPYNALPYLKYLANPTYCHIYFNDLSVRVVDASLGCSDTSCDSPTETRQQDSSDPSKRSWKTVLVGGMRFGGSCDGGTPAPPLASVGFSSYYAIDITDPENPVPMWEFSDEDMGYATTFPSIIRTGAKDKNGYWYVAIGSGSTQLPKSGMDINRSEDGHIYLLDLKTGALVKKETIGSNDDIVGDILTIDEDKDYHSEKLYFGTSYKSGGAWRGSLIRFDIPNQDLSTAGALVKKVLFDDAYPFTASPDAAKDSDGTVWVYAGSGKYYSDLDETDTSGQIFMGVKDKSSGITYPLAATGLTDTSGISTTGTITATTQMCNFNSTSGQFEQQTVVTSINATSAAPSVPTNGWRFPLTGGRRVISRPLAVGGLVDFLAYQPKSDPCSYGGDSYLYSLGFTTGVAPANVAIRASSATGGVTTVGSAVTVAAGVKLGPGAPPTGEAIIIPPPKEGEDTLKKKIQIATGVIVEAENSPAFSVVSKIVHWLKK